MFPFLKSDHEGNQVTLEQLIALKAFSKYFKKAPNANQFLQHMQDSKSNCYGRGMDYMESRLYQPGDDCRNIDWKVSARSNKLHSKIYHKEVEYVVYIVLDLSNTMYFGTKVAFKSVVALQLAALIAWHTLHNNNKFAGLIFNEEHLEFTDPSFKSNGILEFLKKATSIQNLTAKLNFPNPVYNIAKVLPIIPTKVRAGATVIIISDFFNITKESEIKNILAILKKQHTLKIMRVVDFLEETTLPPGKYPVSDLQGNLGFLNVTNDVFKNIKNTYLNLMQSLNIFNIEVSNSENYLYTLLAILNSK